MRSLNYVSGLVLVVVLSMGFSGCGGSDDSTPSSTDGTLTGTFVDAPVQGLNYSTATQSGVTDASGHFKYKSGETVEFKLGRLSLGTASAGTLITPYTLGNSTIAAPSIKKNIAMLLQNLDHNRSDSGKIVISNGLKDFDFSHLDISSSTFDNEVAGLLATAEVQSYIDNNNSLINATNTTNALKKNTGAEQSYATLINASYEPLTTGTYTGPNLPNYVLHLEKNTKINFYTRQNNFNDSFLDSKPILYNENLEFIRKIGNETYTLEAGVYAVKFAFSETSGIYSKTEVVFLSN